MLSKCDYVKSMMYTKEREREIYNCIKINKIFINL